MPQPTPRMMNAPMAPIGSTAKQMLLTIYLDDTALVSSNVDHHGKIEQHLQHTLEQGWKVVSLQTLGCSAEATGVRGWLAVLLERD